MKKIFPIIFILFTSCSDWLLTEKVIECSETNPQFTYEENIKPILEANCTGCHYTNFQSGGLSLSSLEEFNLTNYLVPGDTIQGSILNRILNAENPMPPSGLMNSDYINIIKTWIWECAVEN